MRKKIISLFILSALILSCNSDKRSISDEEVLKIKTKVEKIALDNLKDWEPPFYEEMFLQDFTKSDEFKFTVDGYHINDFKKWKSIVYESMEFDRKNYKHYKHNIINIKTTVLSLNSCIVTVNYIWDYITNDEFHYNVPATVTSVYRFENDNWKIINSHVSHGEKRLLNK